LQYLPGVAFGYRTYAVDTLPIEGTATPDEVGVAITGAAVNVLIPMIAVATIAMDFFTLPPRRT
jgi:hypothetical protein